MIRVRFRLPAALAALVLSTAPLCANAWWNVDFKQRTTVTLNTGAEGVTTTEAINNVAVPVRLHSGNFDFIGAKPDGSDLRVLAADDKTPLKFSVEKFDSANEMAVLWVQVPIVAPGSDKNQLFVYAGNPAAAAEPAAPVVDAGAAVTLRFEQADGIARDAADGGVVASSPVGLDPNGLIGPSARLDGTRVIGLAANDRLKAASGAPYTITLWAKPTAIAGTLYAQGPLTILLERGKVLVRLGRLQFEGGDLPPSAWVHIGVALGAGKATLYVNGAQAAQADLPAAAPAIEGAVRLGQGFNGLLDEVQVAGVTRSADWMKFSRAAQGADAKLVASQIQKEGEAEESEGAPGGYIGVLAKSLTVDAIVVIAICGVMFLVAVWVMFDKTLLIRKTDRGNRSFIKSFRSAPDVLQSGGAQAHPGSSLARLYDSGLQQLQARKVGQPDAPALTGPSLNAVTAAVSADLVRENQKLNSLMVLLTIAISGGPFLGLFGTVVGVMITFAAIAAAGDVNVNAIAPGIAAALLATVAGLGVAIPALIGYNYLASRIKNISSDMSIFVDEFITRVAEQYGQTERP